LTFERVERIGKGDIGGDNNNRGLIRLADIELNNHETRQLRLVLHEIGHNWDDENPHWEKFKELSGWRRVTDRTTPVSADYIRNEEGTWEYLKAKDSAFAGRYARTGPLEDFSESFAAYFLQQAGRSWTEHISGDGPAAIEDKIKLIRAWLANPTAGATGSGGTGSNSLEAEPHDHAHDHAHDHTH
jgi:hypothetical protein